MGALGMGIIGLFLMLGAESIIPWPRTLGEWMGLASGFVWSVATIGIRQTSTAGPAENAFVFALGATVTATILTFMLATPLETVHSEAVFLALGTGALWWATSIAALMWATARLDPARVGILLMAEVLIASVTAAIFANEHLTAFEYTGGALVLLAGVLEVLSDRKIPSHMTDAS